MMRRAIARAVRGGSGGASLRAGRGGFRPFASASSSPSYDLENDAFGEEGAREEQWEQVINERVFTLQVLEKSVSAETFKAHVRAVKEGKAPSKEVRSEVAKAMMDWARTFGAINFAHWASPVRGAVNLQKHDSFFELDFDKPSTAPELIVNFSGSRLFQAETDGSSFPNGGLRQTHRAAAYMAWDRTSPPFVRDDTLYIPSAFVTWNGEALDEKTPLLRSQAAVRKAGQALLPHLGATKSESAAGMECNVGWEQEFFLIDRTAFDARPDLIAAGRTVMGALPPRGQQTAANYFAKMHSRAKRIMEEVQKEMVSLGVPFAVYHNEVAPAQHEMSPIFRLVNLAADHNVLAMEILKEVAKENGMIALTHEKPFKGINGSGKHLNWGLNAGETGRNLFVPGKTPKEQESFMAMVAVLTRAIDLHGDLIRVGVASAGNDHRLGAHEAPPAIISLYLGEGMMKHIDAIVKGGPLAGYGSGSKTIDFGVPELAPISAGVEDRNRTAPFPFCGNRFELRAMGSDGNVSLPLTFVQAAVAESMDHLSQRLSKGEKLRDAVADMYKSHQRIIFNGNGYAKEWHEEAVRRGIPNMKTSVEAFERLSEPKNVELLSKAKILQPSELEARASIAYETFTETVMIEANVMLDMLETGVLPACAQDLALYQGESAAKLAGERSFIYGQLRDKANELSDAIDRLPSDGDAVKTAKYVQDVVRPKMAETRAVADVAERLISSQFYPYPTYGEMFFHPQSETS